MTATAPRARKPKRLTEPQLQALRDINNGYPYAGHYAYRPRIVRKMVIARLEAKGLTTFDTAKQKRVLTDAGLKAIEGTFDQ